MIDKKRIALPLLTSLSFAGSFVAGKYTTLDLQPLTTTLFRYIVALLFLSALLVHYKLPSLREMKRNLPEFILLGLSGVVGYHFFFFTSLRFTAVANTAVINALSPVVTGIMAAIFIKERLTPINYAGVIISVAGVLILVTDGKIENLTGMNFNIGDVFMCCAVVSWAVYALLVKNLLKKYGGFAVTYYAALFGVVQLCILSAFENPWKQLSAVSVESVFAVLYMGIIASGAGYLLYNLSIREIGPTKTSSSVYSIVPVIVAVMALMFFDEPVTPVLALSTLLIIIGLRFVFKK